MALSAVLGDLTWAIAALLVAVILGFQLVARLRRARAQ
jgi:ABC-type phosphate transport system permease subunit